MIPFVHFLFISNANQVIKYGRDISSAMAYVHSVDIIHRDLKADNILIDQNGNAKVADLGLAREVDINMTRMAGTPKWYIIRYSILTRPREAPEVIEGLNYSTPADVYSFGMVLFEMCAGQEPFPNIRTLSQLKAVRSQVFSFFTYYFQEVIDKGTRPTPPSTLPEFIVSLMRSCWEPKPSNRPTMFFLGITIYHYRHLTLSREVISHASQVTRPSTPNYFLSLIYAYCHSR